MLTVPHYQHQNHSEGIGGNFKLTVISYPIIHLMLQHPTGVMQQASYTGNMCRQLNPINWISNDEASHTKLHTCNINHLHTLCGPTYFNPNDSPSYWITPIVFRILYII